MAGQNPLAYDKCDCISLDLFAKFTYTTSQSDNSSGKQVLMFIMYVM